MSFGPLVILLPWRRQTHLGASWTTLLVRLQGLPYDCPELAFPLDHALDQHVLGWVDLLQFGFGIGDLWSSVSLVVSRDLRVCDFQLWLCAAVTLALTTVVTAHICFDAIQVIKSETGSGSEPEPESVWSPDSEAVDDRRALLLMKPSDLMKKAQAQDVDPDDLYETLDTAEEGGSVSRIQLQTKIVDLIMDEASGNCDARKTEDWIRSHGLLLAFIGLCSLSRFESLAIVRLKLRVPTWISAKGHMRPWRKMPIADKYFWRLRFAGLYHYFVEDIPHLLISVLILKSSGCTAHWFPLQRIFFSLFSIALGMLNKCNQRATERKLAQHDMRGALSERLGGSE
jgi:hypothetical protein